MENIKIFFSYNRKDSEFALKLANDLIAKGANVWMDQISIRAGERWDKSVEMGLTTSGCLLVVLSPTSVASENVMDEVSYAIETDKLIMPVIAKECDIPFRIRRFQHIDFTGNYQEALNKLLKELGIQGAKNTNEPNADQTTYAAPEIKENAPKQKNKSLIIAVVVLALIAAAFFAVSKYRSNNSLQTASADTGKNATGIVKPNPVGNDTTVATTDSGTVTENNSVPPGTKVYSTFAEAFAAVFKETTADFVSLRGEKLERSNESYKAKVIIRNNAVRAENIYFQNDSWFFRFGIRGAKEKEPEAFSRTEEIIKQTFSSNNLQPEKAPIPNAKNYSLPSYWYTAKDYRVVLLRTINGNTYVYNVLIRHMKQ